MESQKRRKILFVITKSVWGGAQKYVYDLAVNLPKDNFDVAVAAGGNGPLFDKLAGAGIRTVHIPELERDVSIGKEIASFLALYGLFRREQADIIHLNSSKVGGLGALAGRLAGLVIRKRIRIFFTAHGWGFNEDRSSLARAIIFLASWFSARMHDTIILINAADFRSAKKFISHKKLALIHNGINASVFAARNKARAFFAEKISRPIAPDTLLIGTIAELTKNKGLDYLMCAVNQIKLTTQNPEHNIIIMGEGEERPYLERRIHDLHLENIVFLLGFVPDAAPYLPGLDMFVLPSQKEGLPYALMEAMMAGLPIIATHVGGVPDLITHNENGILVPAKNANALARAIEEFVHDPPQRSQLGQNARETMTKKFSLHDMIEKTQALYEHEKTN